MTFKLDGEHHCIDGTNCSCGAHGAVSRIHDLRTLWRLAMIHVGSLFASFNWVLRMVFNIVEVLELPAIH
jgi:hypothetical protein